MKRVLVVLLLALIVSAAWGQERMQNRETDEYQQAVQRFTMENADTPLGEITVGEYRALLSRLSVIHQQGMFVKKTATASFFMPGSGHFMNDEPGAGVLFGGVHLLLSAGTLVGSYFLLPESVQFTSINYFTDSFADIESAWQQLSFVDILPSIGVMAAGSLVDMIYRGFVARSAGELARERIRSGEEEFVPQIGMFVGPTGMPMMGMRRRF